MNVIDWLLDSDPAIRWQVMRDLTDAPPDEVAAERARVATEGWGAQALAAQPPNGVWGGGAYFPEWISTTPTLQLLREFGLDPDEPAGASRARARSRQREVGARGARTTSMARSSPASTARHWPSAPTSDRTSEASSIGS